MKKFFLTLLAVASVALMAQATDLTGKRIYVNPGHGSWGPNDRPMATIPYPNLPTTGMPDTLGFYESNTNLWKTSELARKLREAGAYVVESRTLNGPWPYTMVDGDYPDYTWAEYQNLPNYTQYNKNLSEICEEVEAGNYDMFISIHSNASVDATTTNYPVIIYSGKDDGTYSRPGTRAICENAWPYVIKRMQAGVDPASAYTSGSSMNVRGDVDFQGSGSWSTRTNGNQYYGYYGVMKHGVPGYLCEGYFHTYQPARHRALNPDYDKDEGIMHYRAVLNYYNADPETTGYILGTVKDKYAKMNHSLFNYAPKTNDQWVPCNGAVVTLKKNGAVVATYTVDNKYNGVFYFADLQPGMYTLEASCDGYLDLDDEQKAMQIEVKANETTYPMIYLVDETWAPDPIVYETYPDLSSVRGVNGKYNFNAAAGVSFANVVAGKLVRQVLVRDDNETYVLALDTTAGAHASYIYKVNTLTGALLQTVSTAGTQGDYYPVYNIAFTADSILVGCNYGENQFGADQVAGGNTKVRGTFRTYYWNMADLTAAPTQWFTSQWSGNYYNANVGQTFAVAGVLASATVLTDAQTIGSSKQIRVAQMVTDNYALVSTCRNQDADNIAVPTFGDYQAIVSPNGDEHALLLGDIKAIEYTFAGDVQAPSVHTNLPAAKGAQAFKFGGKSLLAVPTLAEGAVAGVTLYDITADNAAYGTIVTNITPNVQTNYYSVKPLAQGGDMVIYLATDSAIYRYTTASATQPVLANIYAYGLNVTESNDVYTFSYSLNTEATAARLVFMNAAKEEVYSVELTELSAGAHTATVEASALPDEGELTWAVEAESYHVGTWGVIDDMKASAHGWVRVFNAVNVFPETDHFGEIYLMDRKGANLSTSGLYVMNPDHTVQNTTAYKGNETYYGSPYRFGIDAEGTVWIGDWADPHSGVYVVDPDQPNVHNKFFQGTQNGSGLWTNSNGIAMGSSTPSVYVYGKGADTKLLVYNEDAGGTLPANGLAIYNIGQPDGTIAHTWNTAPSKTITLAGQANTNGNVWGCSQGVWVSQHRSAGNNNSSATSLRFYTWDGECTFASHQAPKDKDDQLIINGSLGSCFALSPDESTIILNGIDEDFMVFDVAWDGATPTLTYLYSYKHYFNHSSDANHYELLQMNWDYAGNLVVSGGEGVVFFAAPKEENRCVTPAKSSLTVHGINPSTALDELNGDDNVEKFFLNGQFFIRRGDAVYTITGIRVK